MGLGIWVVLLVRVWEIRSEPVGGEQIMTMSILRQKKFKVMSLKRKTDLSLRSTGERLSNTSSGSLSIAFQFPTPHYTRKPHSHRHMPKDKRTERKARSVEGGISKPHARVEILRRTIFPDEWGFGDKKMTYLITPPH